MIGIALIIAGMKALTEVSSFRSTAEESLGLLDGAWRNLNWKLSTSEEERVVHYWRNLNMRRAFYGAYSYENPAAVVRSVDEAKNRTISELERKYSHEAAEQSFHVLLEGMRDFVDQWYPLCALPPGAYPHDSERFRIHLAALRYHVCLMRAAHQLLTLKELAPDIAGLSLESLHDDPHLRDATRPPVHAVLDAPTRNDHLLEELKEGITVRADWDPNDNKPPACGKVEQIRWHGTASNRHAVVRIREQDGGVREASTDDQQIEIVDPERDKLPQSKGRGLSG